MAMSIPFILRSQCFAEIGSYELSLIDAEIALEFMPGSFRALLSMGDALYHTASFEYSLLYYNRASRIRPKHALPHEGIAKNKNAIINCLCRCSAKYIFGPNINETKIRNIVRDIMVEEDEQKLREEKDGVEPGAVPSNAEALRRQRLDLNFEMPEQTEFVEEDESSIHTSPSVQSLTPCNEDVLSESSFAKIAGHSSAAKAELEENALQEFESLKAFEGLHVVESEWPDMAKFAQKFKDSLNLSAKRKASKAIKKPKINVDRILLGPLTKDTVFLKRLMNNQKLITKMKNSYGEEVRDVWQDELLKCAKDALDFIDDRREFWRKQEPVYSRMSDSRNHFTL